MCGEPTSVRNEPQLPFVVSLSNHERKSSSFPSSDGSCVEVGSCGNPASILRHAQAERSEGTRPSVEVVVSASSPSSAFERKFSVPICLLFAGVPAVRSIDGAQQGPDSRDDGFRPIELNIVRGIRHIDRTAARRR